MDLPQLLPESYTAAPECYSKDPTELLHRCSTATLSIPQSYSKVLHPHAMEQGADLHAVQTLQVCRKVQ